MAIKKSEIYSQIWAACDKLRGGVEPTRYKDYILTLLFVKYVSDRFKSSDNWDIEVPEGGSFDDIIALKYKKNIGEGINVIIGKLAEANDLKGIIDIADFNSEELGTWISSLVSWKFSRNRSWTSPTTVLAVMTFWATPTNF